MIATIYGIAMDSSSQNTKQAVSAIASAVLECVAAIGEIDAAGGDTKKAIQYARAAALQMPIDEYLELESKCDAQLSPLFQHLKKYGAKLEDSIIILQIGSSKVGITVPADKNRDAFHAKSLALDNPGVKIRYEVTVLTRDAINNTSVVFDGQTKVARFVASLARENETVSK